MKGSSKFSLAIALALIGGNALALGLGSIQLKSRLDQPLNAEIPVLAASPSETAALKVGLASTEDFQRVGLDRARVTIQLDFAIGTNSNGQTVIKVTTKEPVREPFLDFLIEAEWPNGKVLREYTVLLDPPVMAPAIKGSSASVSPARRTPAPARPHKLKPEHPAKSKPAHVAPPHATAHARTGKKATRKPVATSKPAMPAKPATSEPGQYGPVAQGETLSAIARATRPGTSTSLDAYMLAMLKANPDAFFKHNINALKRGAILRIPSAEEIRASGTAAEVLAAVRAQNQAWGAGAPVAKPTLVAKAGVPTPKKSKASRKSASTSAGSSTSGSGHLALVPPRANKSGKATADRPGSSSGSANAASHAELARTKEALVSREQEVGELKSRVKELEDIHGKDQRLLSMKDSELAALQDKLKKLQAQAAAATATPPAAPAAGNAAKPPPSKAQSAANGKPAAKITAKDIWGDINAGEKTSPAANTSPQPAETAAASKPETAGVPATSTTSVANVSAPAAAMAGSATQQPANAQAKPENPPAHTPAKATPVKPKRASKPRPIPPPPTPWYMNTNVLYGGGAILLLAGLILLMRLIRRPKLQPRPATSTAGLEAGFDMPAEDTTLAEEQDMLDRLSRNPADSEAAVELLSLYYANGDAEKFEPVAEDMYAHIADPNQPEWQQVRAMGEELCPHNPLFGGPDDLAATAAYTHEELDHGTTQAIQTEPAAHLDTGLHEDDAQTLEQSFDLGSAQESAPEEPSHDEDEGFDFDLTEHAAPEPAPAPASAEPATAASEELVQSEAQTIPTGEPLPDLPPLEMESSTADDHVAEPAFEPAPVHEETSTPAEEELIASEDAIGTKLDLAKAYLDMGDPEGARSMLDEVMAEGNDAQKDEARKLLDEIH